MVTLKGRDNSTSENISHKKILPINDIVLLITRAAACFKIKKLITENGIAVIYHENLNS